MRVEDVAALDKKGLRRHGLLQEEPGAETGYGSDHQRLLQPNNPDLFKDLTDMLFKYDRFKVFADFDDYVKSQEKVSKLYQEWTKMVIKNIASSGKFSSDRTITDYAKEVWGVEPTDLKIPAPNEPREAIVETAKALKKK
ncbi:hypothetical protein CRUP_031078 [Coryphaenoides rupestris]|nr:hypothetical protein CRUP_031078 [Coryphaenoides rupestris]